MARETLPPAVPEEGYEEFADFELWYKHVVYALTRDEELLTELCEEYKVLVAARAKVLLRPHFELKDIISEGMIGLVTALQRFEPQRSVPFLGYAIWYIEGHIKRHYRDHGYLIRPARVIAERYNQVETASRYLSSTLNREPTTAEIALYLELDVAEVEEVHQGAHFYSVLSYDASTGEDDTLSFVDTLSDEGVDVAELAANRQALIEAMAALPSRYQLVIKMYFFDNLTQRAIGDKMGVSQMEISRTLQKALNILRSHMD